MGNSKEIYAALVKAVNELQNPTNSVENLYFQTSYVPLSDIIDLSKPILSKYGLAVLQVPVVMYEMFSNNMERAVVKVTSTLIHESGESIEFPPMILKSTGKNPNSPQSVGSIITYARRYSLASILGIAGKEEDDDGNVGSGNHQGEQRQNGMPEQRNDARQHQQPQSQNHPQQQKQQQKPKSPHVNVDLTQVKATVISKSEGVSGKGNPYVELFIENEEGKRISVLAKDEPTLSQAKEIEEGTEVVFKIMNVDQFHFVKGIEQVAKA